MQIQIMNPTLTPHPDYIVDESDYSVALRLVDVKSDDRQTEDADN